MNGFTHKLLAGLQEVAAEAAASFGGGGGGGGAASCGGYGGGGAASCGGYGGGKGSKPGGGDVDDDDVGKALKIASSKHLKGAFWFSCRVNVT